MSRTNDTILTAHRILRRVGVYVPKASKRCHNQVSSVELVIELLLELEDAGDEMFEGAYAAMRRACEGNGYGILNSRSDSRDHREQPQHGDGHSFDGGTAERTDDHAKFR